MCACVCLNDWMNVSSLKDFEWLVWIEKYHTNSVHLPKPKRNVIGLVTIQVLRKNKQNKIKTYVLNPTSDNLSGNGWITIHGIGQIYSE